MSDWIIRSCSLNGRAIPCFNTVIQRFIRNYFLQDESDEEEESEKEEPPEQLLGRGARNAVLEQRTRADNSNEEKRAQRQKELARRINEEARIRLQGKTLSTDDKK